MELKLFPLTEQDNALEFASVNQKIHSSENEIEKISSHLDALGANKVMLVCGPNVFGKSGVVQRVEQVLGSRVVGRFTECRPQAPLNVLAAAEAVRKDTDPDTIISVGGGSTMAIVKGLAVLEAIEGSEFKFEDFRMRAEPSRGLVMPDSFPTIRLKVVSVPTTIGCAEIGLHVGGFTREDRSEKITIAGDGQTGPQLIVIDGLALSTTPAHIQQATTMGQLRIAVEGFASNLHNPFSDALVLHAMRLMAATLEAGWQQTPASLLRLKIAASLASMCRILGYGAASATAHQLSAVCGVGHGEGNAVMLAPVVQWNAEAVGPRMTVLADALGLASEDENEAGPQTTGIRIAQFLTTLIKQLGLPTNLRELGVKRESLAAVASAAMRDTSIPSNPRKITSEEEVLEILEMAW